MEPEDLEFMYGVENDDRLWNMRSHRQHHDQQNHHWRGGQPAEITPVNGLRRFRH